jgi:uncharacterized protein
MSVFAAAGWTAGLTWLFVVLLSITYSLREGAAEDRVNHFTCQALAYLLGIFLVLRIHAPARAIREFLGFRSTHVAFFPLAVLLGLGLQAPLNEMLHLIEARWPIPGDPDELLRSLAEAGVAHRVILAVIIVGLVPLLEESVFRGALFQPLRRRYGPWAVIFITSICFTVIHVQWQVFLPHLVTGLCVGYLRAASGSILPPILMHATFNGVPFASMLVEAGRPVSATPNDEHAPLALTLGSIAALLITMALVHLAGRRSQAAEQARQRDFR